MDTKKTKDLISFVSFVPFAPFVWGTAHRTKTAAAVVRK